MGRDLTEFLAHDFSESRLIGEEFFQVLYRGSKLIRLLLDVETRELGESPEWHFKDVVGLDFGEIENFHQSSARRGGVITFPDDLDYFIDVKDRDEQSLK